MGQEKLPKMDAMLREVFRVAYIYRQKYQNPTEDTAFWERAADEMNTIYHHCQKHPFAKGILLACYEDIERELKESRADTQCAEGRNT